MTVEKTFVSGFYSTGGLPPGQYRAVATDGGQRNTSTRTSTIPLGYFGQVYGNPLPCSSCDAESGILININSKDVEDVDFVLEDGPSITGHVIDLSTGLPTLHYVDVYDQNDRYAGSWAMPYGSSKRRFKTGALAAGTYRLVARPSEGYVLAPPDREVPGETTVTIESTDQHGVQLGVLRKRVFQSGFE